VTAPATTGWALDAPAATRILRRCGAMEAGQRVASVEPAAIKVGRRATYRVRLADPEDQLILKCFDQHERALLAANALSAIGTALGNRSLDRVVQPLGAVDGGIVAYRRIGGLRLDEVIVRGSPVEAGGLAARWLAHLHTSPARLERQLDPAREWDTLESWLATLASHDPGAAATVDAIRDHLARRPPVRPAVAVPIHKDLHHGHLFVAPDSTVSAIDLDEARLGPPDFDLAHFVAGLEVLDLLQPADRAGEAAGAFLARYGGATGWRPGADYRWWRAYSLVKLAWQATQGVGPPPMGEPSHDHDGALAGAILELVGAGGRS